MINSPTLQLPRDANVTSIACLITVDGSEIRRSPVEVGSLSHYLPSGKQT